MRKGSRSQADSHAAAAADLAEYFKTAAYRAEVARQRGSYETLLAVRQSLASQALELYWRDGTYSHAANIAAGTGRAA